MRGIVLNQINYRDNLDIVYLYSDERGRRTCLLNRRKRMRRLAPLSLIDFESSGREKSEMQHIKEYVFSPLLPDIAADARKSAIAMFSAEFLYKVLREEEANPSLFLFLDASVRILEFLAEGVANFHLHFMVQLAKHLGFSIPFNKAAGKYFDIKLCEFARLKPPHPQFFDPENTRILAALLDLSSDCLGEIKLSGSQRTAFANLMLNFYSFRFDHHINLKSADVLHEIFL
ncbi:MAG: DNA repair protein RecO [Prevotellaceae bacterium]|nr:DNA repair protein RecO [Prevotellaceae bacterium]